MKLVFVCVVFVQASWDRGASGGPHRYRGDVHAAGMGLTVETALCGKKLRRCNSGDDSAESLFVTLLCSHPHKDKDTWSWVLLSQNTQRSWLTDSLSVTILYLSWSLELQSLKKHIYRGNGSRSKQVKEETSEVSAVLLRDCLFWICRNNRK